MSEQVIEVEPREAGHARRDRGAGYVPAVIYGQGKAAESARVSQKALRELMIRGGHHHMLNLQKKGSRAKPKAAIVKDIQTDPVQGYPLHVDFFTVSLTEKIHAEIPIVVQGEEKAKKSSGILQHQLHAVAVECLPADLPDVITVDVSELVPGEAVHVSDLQVPENVTVLADADTVVASLLVPRKAAAEAAAAATAAEGEGEAAAEGDEQGGSEGA